MENEHVVLIPQLILAKLVSMSTLSVALMAMPTSSTTNSSSKIGDGSSRYHILQPLREKTVELRQPDLPSVRDEPI
jgi:hypothetical protein